MSRLVPVVALIISIALFLLYVKPTYSGPIQETKTKIDSYTAALAAADRFSQKEAELTQARANISADSLARLGSFLPDGVDNVQLILDLDALAARSGVTLSNFDIKATDGSGTSATTPSVPGQLGPGLASNTPVDSLDLTLSASGTYPAFRSFLTGVEQSLRPLDVVNLNVSESTTGVYKYDMTIRIYWLH
ncbi:MAG: hypothetical protein JWN90_149 [Parcubacteria group bacterium]|nr:hypothetical protein [Parcubacteria group bacterium]